MALGQTYNNNREEEGYRPTIYGYSMSNTSESAVDVTNLSFSMWKNSLKIAIAPSVKGGNSDRTEWDRKSAACIYLTPTKAYMLADLLKNFNKDQAAYNGWGVFAGQGLITISDGKEFKGNNPCLTIRKIGENGSVESSYAYEFKSDYHVVLESFNEENGEFAENKSMFANLELEQVIWQLEDYARNSNNAIAFTVCDNMARQNDYISSGLGKIASKLGVELGNGGQKASKGSYFSNGGNKQNNVDRQSSTIDAIMGE